MKKILRYALTDTFPVLTGYLVLGFGFGIILKSAGFDIMVAFLMSFFIYAGSMQYAAIGLLTSGASLITVAITTLMVNARHLFYGISMLDRYRNTKHFKPYLILSLTDETYSLVCSDNPKIAEEYRNRYFFIVSLLNHSYWVIGSLLGAIAGSVIKFSSAGIDFALTALFVTVFIEQWLTEKNHTPAIIGVLVSILCLIAFGAESFLIPTMLIMALLLSAYGIKYSKDKEENSDV